MKKFLALVLAAMLAAVMLTGCGGGDDEEYHVGILQIFEHPALNDARAGFISGLADEGFVEGENLQITSQVSTADTATADQMANSMVEDGVDLLLGNSTHSSQALQRTTDEIPIVFVSVTNPLDARLVLDNNNPGTNLTGMSDRPNFRQQVEFLQAMVPDAQTVGILYNAGEANSVYQADVFSEYLTELGFTPVRQSVTSTADVPQMATNLAEQVDVILTPTCNTVAQAMTAAVNAAAAAGVAIIAGDSGSVASGALGTYGINYYELGRQAASIAAQILRGEIEPQTTPVSWQEQMSIYINTATAAELGFTVPADIMARAIVIE